LEGEKSPLFLSISFSTLITDRITRFKKTTTTNIPPLEREREREGRKKLSY
jgi:hypothetical protein